MKTRPAYILSTGSYLPEKVLENSYFEKIVDTSDEWIQERTGIQRRHMVADHESTATLATEAARKALEQARLTPNDIDLIVVGTASPERNFPSTACFVQQMLGATKAMPCFDLTAACSGFHYAASVATQFVRSGQYRNVLAIGAETLTRIMNWQDRGSCILFGDGAGAAVVSADSGHEILYCDLFADGSKGELITRRLGSRYPATPENLAAGHQFISLEGREVYKVVVNKLPETVLDCLKNNGYSLSDLTWILPHQMNQRIIEASAKRLELPLEKFLMNIQDTGNTSSASVPILMDQRNRDGTLKKGDLVCIVVFGGGFTWGSMLVRW
ncbi:MAG: beta-ketoacyl-ACP synthase III [Planctomycetota bacterium]